MAIYPDIEVVAGAAAAATAAAAGRAILIVDVIDMSTTLESALEAGAGAVLGASPWPPPVGVAVHPQAVGRAAGELARAAGTAVIVVAEPRVGEETARKKMAAAVLAGIREAGAAVAAVVPNLGKETVLLAPFQGQVVVAVTAAGGVCFDAAWQAAPLKEKVVTGTVAATWRSKGPEPALRAARRVWEAAGHGEAGITVVAASARASEDILAAQWIAGLLWHGILSPPPS